MSKKVSEADLETKYAGKYDQGYSYQFLKFIRKKTRTSPTLISGAMGAVVNVLGHFLSALKNPNTPNNVRLKIMGAIAYIVSPIDIIPDAIPVAGFADDLAAAKFIFSSVASYSTFSLKELDDEIDGIVTEKHEDYSQCNGSSEETQAETAVAKLEAPPENEANNTEYDSTDIPIDQLMKDIDKGNELFQKFLDKSAELDNEFNEMTKDGEKKSSDMWDAINEL